MIYEQHIIAHLEYICLIIFIVYMYVQIYATVEKR